MTHTVSRRAAVPDPRVCDARGPEAETLLGFAVAGLVLASSPVLAAPGSGSLGDAAVLFGTAAQQRVLPLVAFLAGAVGTLLADNRIRRGDRPAAVWLGALRALVLLAALGALHRVLHPGDVLLPLAAIAAGVLLPAACLPGWIVMLAGVLGTVLGATAAGGHWVVPGALLLGMAAVRCPPPAWPPRDPRDLWTVLLMGTAGSAGMILGYGLPPGGLYEVQIQSVTGVLTAAAAAAAVLLALRAPLLGPALVWALRPLGRAPVTGYLVATPVLMAAGSLMGPPGAASPWAAAAVATAILAGQVCWSRRWLARRGEGPVEACCRRLARRRTRSAGAGRGRPAVAADGARRTQRR
ncbi:DUF418 domain-containing protein [Marinitenerispora sediminis]|uniref:DUF418 domain-containing protein n=1 Tax=Marinitenerispora sediminis TaxID=1931232 RepID=A0A368T4S4_9ACTN|nr:DUF418 domain-containing protein [Marinitenerispora sediminis]RCV57259.1 hypothetical protein DEF28_01880 [Marinitenerispora sediminis]RCV58278.1 hypothetical protein DEF23_09335 [Marinitenerispora sediminis]RCV58501.1 hypothetical protein DEF24_13370 [Marinitenerispora sediminis]